MNVPVILEATRTPFAKKGRAYSDIRPDTMMAALIRATLARAELPASLVEDVILGCVSQAGEQGGNVARQSALLAGLPIEVPGVTLNRMCGSGQTAVHFAAQAIAAGDMDFVLAGGVESMSRVPMFADVTLGAPFVDWSGLNPDLLAQHELPHQGVSAELVARDWQLTRSQLDEYAIESHRRAAEAARDRRHVEIVALEAQDLNLPAEWKPLQSDEGIRYPVDIEKMASLAPIFAPHDGVITAGNASQMTDGAALVLIANEERARAQGLQPKAHFLSRVTIGSDPRMQLDGVIQATKDALGRARLELSDVDWIEINEAFACVPLAWSKAFGVAPEQFNRWGGAIAHGHPLGATGAGLLAKTLAGLEATDGETGLVVFCVGHGMSTATVVRRVN